MYSSIVLEYRLSQAEVAHICVFCPLQVVVPCVCKQLQQLDFLHECMIFIYLYQQAKLNFCLHNYHFYLGVRPQLTFLFTVSHECRAREIVKFELNKFILCDMSAFEHEYSQVCLQKLLAVKQCIFLRV